MPKALQMGLNMRKLYRDTKNRKICGVCAGVAAFFGIDATWVRLGWALLSIWWGTGILIYLIAALVIPEAQERVILEQDDWTM